MKLLNITTKKKPHCTQGMAYKKNIVRIYFHFKRLYSGKAEF
jgi:hypothetical protein